jgi:MinD-like ATPase involved in chromosome partitioning or flagellar assembly
MFNLREPVREMLAMAIHSYRGGTGKTLLSTNLAAAYSRKEKVCLLDYDLRAPSLLNMFNVKDPKLWINDFLNGDCEIDECIYEAQPNLFVGFANSNSEAIRDMMGKSRSWETGALSRTISLKDALDKKGFKKLIFDTAPGMIYSSINAVIGSDVVALVMRMDAPDILGTKEMAKGVYELLEKPTFVVVNMILPPQRESVGPVLEKTFGKQTLAYIPCQCDVRGFIARGKEILIDEKLEYAEAVLRLANEIEKLYVGKS